MDRGVRREPEQPAQVDVLVVGADPTGLTRACGLRRRGIMCRVVEKATKSHRRSRGKGLQARSLEVLDDLDITETAVAVGRSDSHHRVYVGGRLTADMHVPARPDVPCPSLLLIPLWRTEEILRDRLESFGGSVELGHEPVNLQQDAGGETAMVADRHRNDVERVGARYGSAATAGTAPSGSCWACSVGYRAQTPDTEDCWHISAPCSTAKSRDNVARAQPSGLPADAPLTAGGHSPPRSSRPVAQGTTK